MRSRILAAVAATSLLVAAPSAAGAQEEHHSHTGTVVGITFALTAILILILAKSHHNNLPTSP